DREVRETLLEGARVLVGENRRRHEDRNLPSALHGLECGAHGDLRLAVAHVADEEAVHRTRALHVLLHVGRRLALVWSVFKQKTTLELALPRRVGDMRRPRGDFAPRVEVEQLEG